MTCEVQNNEKKDKTSSVSLLKSAGLIVIVILLSKIAGFLRDIIVANYYGASLVKTVDALYIYEKTNFDEATRQKVEKAISVSDNTAHNQLVRQIGIQNLREYGRGLGAKNFLTRANTDHFGNTTVYDQIAIWKHLYNFVNTNPKGSELKRYFINDYYSFMQFEGIPTTMHKYGWYGNFYHDVGIVYSDKPYLVVILTKHGAGNYKQIAKDLSQKIYELNKIDD
jgi:hypothetical protein